MQAQDGDHGFEKMIAVGGALVDTNDCHHDFGKVCVFWYESSIEERFFFFLEHKLLLIPSNACTHMDLTLWEKDLVVLTIFFFSVLGAAPSIVREDHLCNQGQGCYV
ncbi:hypothetical protein BDL97_01G106500 [Sphagnum fallax]|nr:hypothetical protein BDL97_01G106500 [Sphagnum fallax]